MKILNSNRLWFLMVFAALFIAFRPAPDEKLEKAVLKETNDFRKSRGKKLLQLHDGLSDIARKHSEAMASGKVPFSHQDFKLREKEARKLLGAAHSAVAENVAYGAQTAAEVVKDWKNSPGHRQNLLGNYRYIGIGTATAENGSIYYTQIFVE